MFLFVAVQPVIWLHSYSHRLEGKNNNPPCSVMNWLKTSLQSIGQIVSLLFPSCPHAMLSLSSFPHWDSILSVVCSRSPNRIYDSLTQIMFPLTISEEILFHSGLLNLQETYIKPWNSPSPIRPTKEHITSYLLRSP